MDNFVILTQSDTWLFIGWSTILFESNQDIWWQFWRPNFIWESILHIPKPGWFIDQFVMCGFCFSSSGAGRASGVFYLRFPLFFCLTGSPELTWVYLHMTNISKMNALKKIDYICFVVLSDSGIGETEKGWEVC